MLEKKVYLFPSCAARLFENNDNNSMSAKIISVLKKLKYEVEILNLNNECCGLMYHSMGLPKVSEKKLQQLIHKMNIVTNNENCPVLIENTSCILEVLSNAKLSQNMPLFVDPISFVYNELKNYSLKKLNKTIMLHVNCSVTKLKKNEEVIELANRCVTNIVIPNDILCCGFAGSKGFTNPELNINALKTLKEFIPENCNEGYTCLETCSLGFTK